MLTMHLLTPAQRPIPMNTSDIPKDSLVTQGGRMGKTVKRIRPGLNVITNFAISKSEDAVIRRQQGVESLGSMTPRSKPRTGTFVNLNDLKSLSKNRENQRLWSTKRRKSKTQVAPRTSGDAGNSPTPFAVTVPQIGGVGLGLSQDSLKNMGLPTRIQGSEIRTELSPSDGPIVIGMSVPATEAVSRSYETQFSANTQSTLTPTIVITPAEDMFQRGLRSGLTPHRPASSIYSTATPYLNTCSAETDAPPVPTIATTHAVAARDEYEYHRQNPFDDQNLAPSVSGSPRADARHVLRRTSIDTIAVRPQSKGWWNLMLSPLSPFLGRSNTISTIHIAKKSQDEPIHSLSQDYPDYPSERYIDDKNEHFETPSNRATAASATTSTSDWSDWGSNLDGKRNDEILGPHAVDVTHAQLDAATQGMSISPDTSGLAAEYFLACAHDAISHMPYFECERHSCAEKLPTLVDDPDMVISYRHEQKSSFEAVGDDERISSDTEYCNTNPHNPFFQIQSEEQVASTPEKEVSPSSTTSHSTMFEDVMFPAHSPECDIAPTDRSDFSCTMSLDHRAITAIATKFRIKHESTSESSSWRLVQETSSIDATRLSSGGKANPLALATTVFANTQPATRYETAALTSGSGIQQEHSPESLPADSNEEPTGDSGPPPYSPPRKPPRHPGNIESQRQELPLPTEACYPRAQMVLSRQQNSIALHGMRYVDDRSAIPASASDQPALRPVYQSYESAGPFSRPNAEKRRQLPEQEERFHHQRLGGCWRGRGYISNKGCLGQSGPAGRSKKMLYIGLTTIMLLIVITVLILAILLTRQGDVTPIQSQWLNLTGYPPMPTGIATIAQPDNVFDSTGCISPSVMWSCAVPKEDQADLAPNNPDQPNLRVEIRFRNGSFVNSTAVVSPSKPKRSYLSVLPIRQNSPNEPVYSRDLFTEDLYTAIPSPPSEADQIFLGNTTDNITEPTNGEPAPFYITMVSTSAAASSLTKRASNTSDSFPDLISNIPSPATNTDGTAAAAMLLPLPSSQPVRLYNRGLRTEHYGFYTYFDRSIFLKSTQPLNASSEDDLVADANGGSKKVDAKVQCTWAQTRFLVQIWTKGLGNGMALLPSLNGSSPGTTLTNSSATDFSRPGSFPYPVTVTLDRHGGNEKKKMVYCYGLDGEAKPIDGDVKLQLENRSFGGTLTNPSQGIFNLTRSSSTDSSYGGIDGGTGGCGCRWQNWQDQF